MAVSALLGLSLQLWVEPGYGLQVDRLTDVNRGYTHKLRLCVLGIPRAFDCSPSLPAYCRLGSQPVRAGSEIGIWVWDLDQVKILDFDSDL